MASELEIVRSEVETLLKNIIIFPNNVKSTTEFDDSVENDSWPETINTQITSFKKIALNFQNMLVWFLFL